MWNRNNFAEKTMRFIKAGAMQSVLEQVVNSIISLVVLIILIYLGSAVDVGRYALLVSAASLISSSCGALVWIPAQVVVPTYADGERLSVVLRILLLSVIAASICSVCGLLVYLKIAGAHETWGILVALNYLLFFSLRDFFRYVCIILNRTSKMAYSGVVQLFVTSIGVCVISIEGVVSLEYSLFVMNLGLLASLLVSGLSLSEGENIQKNPEVVFSKLTRDIWSRARWSFPGAVLAWLHGQAYIGIVYQAAGPNQVALIAAARAWATPLSTIFGALSRVHLSKISEELSNDLVARKSTILPPAFVQIIAVGFGYLVLLLFAGYLGIFTYLPKTYQESSSSSAIWVVLAAISAIRVVKTNEIQAQSRFMDVFIATLATSAFSVTGCVLAAYYGSDHLTMYIALPLLVSEFFLIVWTYRCKI